MSTEEPVTDVVVEWEVWLEGYCVTGSSAKATFCGKFKGVTFEEAVLAWVATKGEDGKKFYNPESGVYWGCNFYDNEAEARKTFG